MNTKRTCERECLHSKRKVLSPDFKESENAESFEINCQVCLRPSHDINTGTAEPEGSGGEL